jgi:AAA family ATP:ADP antiporter
MRPIREQMGVAGGVDNLQWLFTATLAGLLLLNLPFAYLVKTLPRTRFIPITYRFFAANILLFALLLHFVDAAHRVWIGRAFFVWISVFNLFVVSVFWALVVDVFNSEQGKRLFGFIAAAATIGAIFGSGITASLARHVPVELLLIGAALLLEVAVLTVRGLSRLSAALHARPDEHGERPIGGNLFAGITRPFKSAYLANISLFILLFAITSTFLYFQQATLVRRAVVEIVRRWPPSRSRWRCYGWSMLGGSAEGRMRWRATDSYFSSTSARLRWSRRASAVSSICSS